MKAAGVGIKALLLASQFAFLRCGLSLNLGFIDFACLAGLQAPGISLSLSS